jgi:branched-chain amino acid transport system permease protein
MQSTEGFYYFTLTFFMVSTFIMYTIVRSPFGLALVGIRESERRMEVLGYNTRGHKYLAFVMAGVFAGLAGTLFAYYNGYVSPIELSVVPSATVLLMVTLGGPGSFLGPLLGAGTIVFLEDIVSTYTERWVLCLGVMYVLVVMFAPQGIVGALSRLVRKAGD